MLKAEPISTEVNGDALVVSYFGRWGFIKGYPGLEEGMLQQTTYPRAVNHVTADLGDRCVVAMKHRVQMGKGTPALTV